LKSSFASVVIANSDLAVEEAKAAVLLFYSMLNERQRPLDAGLASLKLGMAEIPLSRLSFGWTHMRLRGAAMS